MTDWSRLEGMRCVCRPFCTDVRWGDAGRCDPACEPCRVMAGVVYSSPVAAFKAAKKDAS